MNRKVQMLCHHLRHISHSPLLYQFSCPSPGNLNNTNNLLANWHQRICVFPSANSALLLALSAQSGHSEYRSNTSFGNPEGRAPWIQSELLCEPSTTSRGAGDLPEISNATAGNLVLEFISIYLIFLFNKHGVKINQFRPTDIITW